MSEEERKSFQDWFKDTIVPFIDTVVERKCQYIIWCEEEKKEAPGTVESGVSVSPTSDKENVTPQLAIMQTMMIPHVAMRRGLVTESQANQYYIDLYSIVMAATQGFVSGTGMSAALDLSEEPTIEAPKDEKWN